MNISTRSAETCLPPKDAFYSSLKEEGISDDDYERAQNVWKELDCKTLKDYHDHYLKTDVLLLADVFENFRKVGMNNYGLDPAQYYTLPGYSWDACLKHTQVELSLLRDPEIHLFSKTRFAAAFLSSTIDWRGPITNQSRDLTPIRKNLS